MLRAEDGGSAVDDTDETWRARLRRARIAHPLRAGEGRVRGGVRCWPAVAQPEQKPGAAWSRRRHVGRRSEKPTIDFKLPKSEIFAIVFRWIGQSEIASEGGVRASVRPETRAVGNFLFASAVTH